MFINGTWRALPLVAALAAAPASAQTLGGNPNPQDLQTQNPINPGNGCQSPISVMSALSAGEMGATLTVTNNSASTTLDMVNFDLVVNGERWLYARPVKLAPGKSVEIDAYFHQPVSSPVISLCANKPVGVVDEAQPVMTVVETPTETAPE